MNMIYNSQNYCVVEFGAFGAGNEGGYEIMDKHTRREIFLEGSMAETFRSSVATLIASEPSVEEIDDFLSRFDGAMRQPMTLH